MSLPSAAPSIVRVARDGDGPAIIAVILAASLDTTDARAARDAGRTEIARIEGRPFGLLIDTRAVSRADEAALAHVRELEGFAARSGHLVRLCHLVKSEAHALASAEKLRAAGFPELFRDFVDEREALRYLRGVEG